MADELKNLRDNMDKAVSFLQSEYLAIRTGLTELQRQLNN